MNRSAASPSRRVRTLGLVLAVVAAGFAVAALTVGIVFVLSERAVPVAAMLAFGGVAALTLVVTGVVTWTLAAERGAHADAADMLFDAQQRLLDDVRHELKTPITIVRGHLEVMDPADIDDVAAIRDLGIAELDRMTRLIGDIDLLATVSNATFTMAEVDLASLTGRMFELVSVIPGNRWSVEASADETIHGDGDRLLQAWLQLADNAAKYSPDTTPIEIGSAVHASGAQLWVRDHGPGIPPAMRHRIFRRFDRGGMRRVAGGSGLGLTIVETIAKAHGGHCHVADTPRGGATFTIEIPLGTGVDLPRPVRAGDVVMQREAAE